MGSSDILNANEINNFDNDFLKYLCVKSQLHFRPTLNTADEDEYSQCFVSFQELERFVVGTDSLMTEKTMTDGVCGMRLKSKEQGYICRDCATDTTCRFCRSCFVQSEHIKHNYQMFTNTGGGFCDCGDTEAWKSFPRCNLHGSNAESSLQISKGNYTCLTDIEDCTKNISNDVQLRFLLLSQQIFSNIKQFIWRSLCKDNDALRQEELKRELTFVKQHCSDTDVVEYCLVLYNNEIHNFDQIISILRRCLLCTTEQAMEYANIVDLNGRCVALSMHMFKEIYDKQQEILTTSKMQTKVEFLCRLHHPIVLAIQNYLLHSLRWLSEFVSRYPSLRLLLCHYLFHDVFINDGRLFEKSPFIEDLFGNFIETWKMVRSSSMDFLMSTVMKESYFKTRFAVQYVENYKMIVGHYARDDHNIQDSLISLSCQIFTLISVATYLLEHNNVLTMVSRLVYHELVKHSKPLVYDGVEHRDVLIFHKDEHELHRRLDPYERYLKSFGDIKFLLTSLVTAFTGHAGEGDIDSSSVGLQQWTDQCIVHFVDYVGVFADILALIHETNTIERVIDHHVEDDPQWRTGIILMYDLAPCITLTSDLIVSNKICWDQAFKIVRQTLKKRIVNFESKKRTLFEYSTYTANVLENNSPNKIVSIIKPLHRLMSTLLLRTRYIGQLTQLEIDCLFDQALQMVVFSSQQSGNMWIRNGSVPYILSQQMRCLTLSSEMFDRDLQLLQQLALCMSPDKFMLKCIHKFDLKPYLTSSSDTLWEKKSIIQRVEDFLHLLIMTLFFRHRSHVGKNITEETCYEHLILHILCTKLMSHSKIMKKLPPRLEKYPKSKLMNIIDRVADKTTKSQIVMFNAKQSLIMVGFDRFSPYYSIQDRNEADIFVRDVFRKETSSSALIPPRPIELSKDFSGLYRYLSDPCFVGLLDRIIFYCTERRNGEYWTDTILDMVLHLIGSCLLEDINVLNMPKEDRRPIFLETALNPNYNIRIIDNLEQLSKRMSCDQQRDLIKWIIRKWHDVKRNLGLQDLSCKEVDTMEVDYENLTKKTETVKIDAAKARKLKLMNNMRDRQQIFLSENCKYLMELSDPADVKHNCDPSSNEDLICILCQEKFDGDEERPFVAIAGAWRSTVLARHPFTSQALSITDTIDDTISPVPEHLYEGIDGRDIIRESFTFDDDDLYGGDIDRVVVRSIFPMLDHAEETFITTCGHVMHYDCKTRYVTEMVKHKQNIARTKGILYPRIFNRCPLCRCVCNIDIPIETKKDTSSTLGQEIKTMTFKDWISFFATFSPNMALGHKKVDKTMHWWNKLGHQLSNIMKMTIPFKRNDYRASNSDLLSCLAFRVGLAIKLQPRKLTKDTYNKYESVCNSISDSSLQDIIELDYAVAYTMSVWEQLLSQKNGSLLTDMPERHMLGLHYLIRAVNQSHLHISEKESLHRNCQSFLILLQQLLFDSTKSSLHKVWLDLYKYKVPLFILEVDFTYIMTSLVLMRCSFNHGPDTGQSLTTDEQQLLSFIDIPHYNMQVVRLLYEFVCVQALISLTRDNRDDTDIVFAELHAHSPDLWTEDTVERLYLLWLEISHRLPTLSWPVLSRLEVAISFTRAVLPYMRCGTFLLAALGSVKHDTNRSSAVVEFNHLIRVLDLSIVPEWPHGLPLYIEAHLAVLGQSQCDTIQTIWGSKLPHTLPHRPLRLVDLPADFTDVVTLCLGRGCSLSHQAAGAVTKMALCLICGDTFCLSGYCCRRPESSSQNVINGAQIHARQCHGGFALFLNTRNSNVIVLFYQARWQISLSPIYLDKYGEADIDLNKGNPLFLKAEAYDKLQRSWLDHSIGCIINEGFLSNDFFV